MCIHHVAFHTPCGHTTQTATHLVHCSPVTAALTYYNRQPELALLGQARFGTHPMKAPQPCGGKDIKQFRTIHFVGQDRTFAPPGWQAKMTMFMKSLLQNGEDPQSIIILMETEFPSMASKISEKWVCHIRDSLRNPNLRWSPPNDLENGDFAGNIITDYVTVNGCGGFRSGNPNCFVGWPNPDDATAFCAFKRAIETGMPMPRCPEHTTFSNDKIPFFPEQLERELYLQACDSLGLCGGPGHDSQQDNGPSSPTVPHFATSITESPNTTLPGHADLDIGLGLSTSIYRWPVGPKEEEENGRLRGASI